MIKKKRKKREKSIDIDKDIWIIEGYYLYDDEPYDWEDIENYAIKLPFLRMSIDDDYWTVLREAQYIFALNDPSCTFKIHRIYKGKLSEVR